jgi:hypothetical protein
MTAKKSARRTAGPTVTRARSAASERLIERARKICSALPDAVEKLSHGEPTWFAGKGKVYASIDDHHHGAPHCSLWLPLPPGAQQTLVASDPDRYFRPPYVGHKGWVGVVLDGKPDWKTVAALVEEAYRHVASARLVEKLDAR